MSLLAVIKVENSLVTELVEVRIYDEWTIAAMNYSQCCAVVIY
tara:strand:+ start:9165 stop:9293 length:129 start_codon:yes stop_codon:yes gene_type:complete